MMNNLLKGFETNQLITEELEHLSRYISHNLGLEFPPHRWKDLERNFLLYAEDSRAKDPRQLLKDLLSSPPTEMTRRKLARWFTIGETYFMREAAVFKALRNIVLPGLIRQRRERNLLQLRIWSAGCSSGEEPYSLAIVLKEMLPDFDKWKLDILATDINPDALQKAQRGKYTEWSFRRTPAFFRQKYFRQASKKQYEISPEIKKMVCFEELNLAEFPWHPRCQGQDIILCRNVLLYFSSKVRNRILTNFSQCLTPQGWLILSPSETYSVKAGHLTPVHFPDVIFYQNQILPTAQTLNIQARTARPALFSTPSSRNGSSRSPVASIRKHPRGKANGNGQEKLERAQRLFLSHDYQQAIEVLAADRKRQEIESSETTEVLILLSKCFANLGNLPVAQSWCDAALRVDKLNPEALYLRAVLHLEKNELQPAADLLQKVLFLEPKFVIAHFTLGNIEFQLGRSTQALRHFRNALSLLASMDGAASIPHSDGMSVAQLRSLIDSLIQPEVQR